MNEGKEPTFEEKKKIVDEYCKDEYRKKLSSARECLLDGSIYCTTLPSKLTEAIIDKAYQKVIDAERREKLKNYCNSRPDTECIDEACLLTKKCNNAKLVYERSEEEVKKTFEKIKNQ